MNTVSGTLVIKKTKKGDTFSAAYVNLKGTPQNQPLTDGVVCFDKAQARDGDPLTIVLNERQTPAKVTIDGKEVREPVQKQPAANKMHQSRQGSGWQAGGHRGSMGQGGGIANRGPARRDATAPYNFIPYDPALVIDGLEQAQSGPFYSGSLVCRLEALTPLLVCGTQDKDDKHRRFFAVQGKKVIPGSSLKGMLRSLVELLSFSRLAPINDRPLVYRCFNDSIYKKHMGSGLEGKQKAGWLVRNGADYRIEETDFIVEAKFDPKNMPGYTKVQTGRAVSSGKGQRKEGPNVYYVAPRSASSRSWPLDREQAALFRAQLTKPQIEMLKDRRTNEDLTVPCPIFFVLDEAGAEVLFVGLPRYFRLPYAQKAVDLLAGERKGLDFASRLFGATGRGQDTFRGRVSVGAAALEEAREITFAKAVTLGQPLATCIAHYLVQDGTPLRMPNNSENNDPDTMRNYNSPEARLRGRKLYWHRDCEPETFPPGSENTSALLHPADKGCSAFFKITLERVSLEELGALLEALVLPQGHAHKLGLGKSLGLGSVRIEVRSLDVRPEGDCYRSLAGRFASAQTPAPADLAEQAAGAFKAFVLEELRRRGCSAGDFEELEAIRALRVMQRYTGRPANKATAFLELNPKTGGLSYKNRAILPGPLEVAKTSGSG